LNLLHRQQEKRFFFGSDANRKCQIYLFRFYFFLHAKRVRLGYFLGRRMTMRCPGVLSSSRRLMLLSLRASADDATNGSCVWTESSTPQYMATSEYFNFTMAAYNEVANMTQYVGLVHNYAIGK
jgi:hypothetical protein